MEAVVQVILVVEVVMHRGQRELEARVKELEEQVDSLQGEQTKYRRGRYGPGVDFKSERMVMGVPLVHVATGWNPDTNTPRVARGFIAIGNIAYGVFALGGVSLGVFSLGGVSLGLVTFGGLSIGLLLGMGGLAIGGVALGGMAIGYYAVGGGAFGVHTISGAGADPEAIRFFKSLLPPSWKP